MKSVLSLYAPCSTLLVFCLLTGCATPVPHYSSTPSLHHSTSPLSVPFIAQKANYCGPAALAMLANYHGHKVSQDEIAAAIYLPEIRGTLTADLADYAARFNLWVRQYRGTQADLRHKLAAGVPVIVLGRFGANFHYFVVLGFDDFTQTVIVHSDSRPCLELRQEDFLRFWNNAERWTLLVCPPDRAMWTLSADEHNDLGVFLERTGHLAAAAGNYRRATELQPANSCFQMNLGNALIKQKLFTEAAAANARAVKLDPGNADAMNNLAWTYCELGANLDEAVQLCERAVKLRPSSSAYYLDTLGSVYLKQRRVKEAIEAFESALAATTERESSLRAAIQQRLAAARALLEK
ncbi:MAG: PA2778 family cysteine peptidase [Verrucomicrobiia bacterium]